MKCIVLSLAAASILTLAAVEALRGGSYPLIDLSCYFSIDSACIAADIEHIAWQSALEQALMVGIENNCPEPCEWENKDNEAWIVPCGKLMGQMQHLENGSRDGCILATLCEGKMIGEGEALVQPGCFDDALAATHQLLSPKLAAEGAECLKDCDIPGSSDTNTCIVNPSSSASMSGAKAELGREVVNALNLSCALCWVLNCVFCSPETATQTASRPISAYLMLNITDTTPQVQAIIAEIMLPNLKRTDGIETEVIQKRFMNNVAAAVKVSFEQVNFNGSADSMVKATIVIPASSLSQQAGSVKNALSRLPDISILSDKQFEESTAKIGKTAVVENMKEVVSSLVVRDGTNRNSDDTHEQLTDKFGIVGLLASCALWFLMFPIY